jgi:hypothetical protein
MLTLLAKLLPAVILDKHAGKSRKRKEIAQQYEVKMTGERMNSEKLMSRGILNMRSYLLAFSLLIAAALLPSTVKAEGVAWESLTTQQQETLGDIKDGWNDLPPHRQERLSKGADKWATMSPEQRQQIKQKLNRYKNLPPEEKARVKERMHQFKQLPPEEREALRERWQNMDPDKKARFRERMEHRGPDERHEGREKFKQKRQKRGRD